MFDTKFKQIFFIDSDIANDKQLLNGLPKEGLIYVLNGDQSALIQMAEVHRGLTGINAIHLISHGSPGVINLTGGDITAEELIDAANVPALETIRNSLSDNADFFIYGCHVAEGQQGQGFIQALAQVTHTNVCASTNVTGSSALGGDWDLMASTGIISAQSLRIPEFRGLLAAPTISGLDPTITYTEGGSPIIIDNNIGFSGGSNYGGGFVRYSIASSNSDDQLVLNSSNTPNASGEISVSGGAVFLGNGSDVDEIGIIDTVENGVNGQPLKINFIGDITNSGFETGGDSVTGWTIGEQQVKLGATVIAGWTTPSDSNLPSPIGSNQTTPASATFDSETAADGSDSPEGGGTGGSSSLRLFSNMTTTDGFDVVNGPYAESNTFESIAGDVFFFDWKAAGGSDAYDAFGYLLNADDGTSTIIINQTGADASASTPWATLNVTVPTTGNYKFVFVSGTWDATGGKAAGGSLFVDNFKVFKNSVTDAIAQSIVRSVSYESTGNDSLPSRVLTVSAADGNGATATSTSDLVITQANNAPTFTGNGSLPDVMKDTANPSGASVSSIMGSLYSDPDTAFTPADTLAGIAVVADGSLASEGDWEYSTDSGSTWNDIGTVSTSSALLLSSASLIRFVSAANYSGTPGSLSVHAVDSSAGLTFTNGLTRETFDTTAGGSASAVSASAVALGTTITVNDAPIVAIPIPDVPATNPGPGYGSGTKTYTIPGGTFTDANGDTLTYTAVQLSGAPQTESPLPAWLTLDPATGVFSGNPPHGTTSPLTIQVAATDPGGLNVTDTFNWSFADTNDLPSLSNPLVDQSHSGSGSITPYTFATNTFTDNDPSETLTYTAGEWDGANLTALPGWLTFDPATRTFSGNPPAGTASPITIRVATTDSAGATVTDDFDIVLSGNLNDIGNLPDPAQSARINVFEHLNDITITDEIGSTQNFTVNLTPTNGSISGLTDLDSNPSNGIQLSGTAASINAMLASAQFRTTATGAASIAIEVTDSAAPPNVTTATYQLSGYIPNSTPAPEPEPEPTPTPTPTPAPTSTQNTVDGVVVDTSTTTNGNATTTVPIITSTRTEDSSTENETLADIPLGTNDDNQTILQVSLPNGVGLTSEETVGTGMTLREKLIAASDPKIDDTQVLDEILRQDIDTYVGTVSDENQVILRDVTFTASDSVANEPIIVTGALGKGENDLNNPLRQEALVIDTRNLSPDTELQLDDIEFAIIIGSGRFVGEEGRKFIVDDGDVTNQFSIHKLVDGVAIDTSTATEDSTTTSTTTVPIIVPTRSEDLSTDHTAHADIPLITNNTNQTILQVSLPNGVGLTSEETTETALTLREKLIAASDPKIDDTQVLDGVLQRGIDVYVPTVTDESQVTLRTVTFSGSERTDALPIIVSGALGTGEDDLNNPLRQETLVIDTRNLSPDTELQLDNVEFAIVTGSARIIGGEGRNFIVGDDANQFIVSGEGDDRLLGGFGDDKIGARDGNDLLFGDEGDDYLIGGLGDDMLEGGDGDDLLQGGQSDAGTLTFSLNDQNQVVSTFTIEDSALSSASTVAAETNWFSNNVPITNDNRVSFVYRDSQQLETISTLSQSVLDRLPTTEEMNIWTQQALPDNELGEIAHQVYLDFNGNIGSAPVETQMAQLLTHVWGADQVNSDWVNLGIEHINNGGNWGDALLFMARHDNLRSTILDNNDALKLTQNLQTSETGWSSDTGSDTLIGGQGNDTLVGGYGHNLLDGGLGVDTVLVTETADSHRIVINNDGRISVHRDDKNALDDLIDIENVNFSDQTLDVRASNLDPTALKEMAGLANLIDPSILTLENLNQVSEANMTTINVSEVLMTTDSYQQNWGTLSNLDFTSKLGNAVLDAPLTDLDLSFWDNQLDQGAIGRDEMMVIAVGVAEYQDSLFAEDGLLLL